jgi:spore coat polysaccharide biosynthesis protein SpsF (cytidylyltransferase family)
MTHTVRTTVTITTDMPFLSIYNAEKKVNEIKDNANDYKNVLKDGNIVSKKTKVEIIKRGAE